MSTGNTPVLYSSNGEWLLSGEHTEEQLQAARAVGYVNRFRVGVFEAVQEVQDRCPEGWNATALISHAQAALPAGVVQVGQVKCRHGDPAFPLYIYPRL